jgi:hypothetical protein
MNVEDRTNQETKTESKDVRERLCHGRTVVENCSCIFDTSAMHGGRAAVAWRQRSGNGMDVGGRTNQETETESKDMREQRLRLPTVLFRPQLYYSESPGVQFQRQSSH